MSKVNVYPGVQNPTHEISLSDGVQTWGLRLDGGPKAVQETPLTPSTLHISNSSAKFGDWEPGMSHIEQRTWEGGRGQADFVDDPTRFFDSKMAWTLTPGKVFPAPNWRFSDPGDFYSEGTQNLPGDLSWRALYGNYRNIAEPVTHSSNWGTYNSVWLWVRRVGTPLSDLAVELWAKTLGYPDPLLIPAQGSVAITDIPENESTLVKVDLSGGSALVGTESFIVVFGQLNDNAANHWEIGIDEDGGTAFYGDGGGWLGNAAFSIYHRLLSAGKDRRWRMFEYLGALYAVDQPADGSASKLFINGNRGKATSATITTLADTNKSWTADEWISAWVKITAGKGVGQTRQITGNTTTGLTVTTWDITPDSTSEYVIYHTPIWQDISPASGDQFDAPVTCLAVADEQVLFGFDGEAVILKMRWNASASPPAHEFDDDNDFANFFVLTQADTGEPQIHRIRFLEGSYCFIEKGGKSAWGTNIDFGSRISIGSSHLPINGMLVHDGNIYAFKPDGRYQIAYRETRYGKGKATSATGTTLTDTNQSWTPNEFAEYAVRIVSGTGNGQRRTITANSVNALTVTPSWAATPDTSSVYLIYQEDAAVTRTLGQTGFTHSRNNGEAALSYGLHAYFSWGGYALQKLYDASGSYTLTSIGPDREEGLPDDRRGRVVDLLGIPPGIMAAVQGDGFSSVMVLPNGGSGWHEVFRGWASGTRIDQVHFQDSYRPRLWVSIGGELAYQDWPRHSFNPLKDPGLTYHHEAVLVSSTIDMGVSSLTKFIESITATLENLTSGIEVSLDYQTNENTGTDRWIEAGSFQINPWDTLNIQQGEVYRIRFRLRLRTNHESIPPVVLATVLEGFARTPVKYRWDLQVTVSDSLLSRAGTGYDANPDAFLNWLKQAAVSSRRIYMRSIWEQLDNRYVIVEPPALVRKFTNEVTGFWGGQVQVSLREI